MYLRFERAFDIIDANKDGYVRATELKKAFKKTYGGDPYFTTDEFGEIVDMYDKNGDAKLSLQEFRKFWGEVASSHAMHC